MNLRCELERASGYHSASQIARIVSEHWCARELYCPACNQDRLTPSAPNRPAVDFECPNCNQLFQLKSVRNWNQKKIVDAGYFAMIRAIRHDANPNLFLLHYSKDWCVRNLLLVPKVFFTESVIERRPPLSENARRAGWVGCNILLHRIPADGKIAIVREGAPTSYKDVRGEFARIRKLSEVPPSIRGWTLDVLNVIRKLRKTEFSLRDVYSFESELSLVHPQNKNIRPKVRQQLQVLRDLGMIKFTSSGQYSVA